MLADLINSPVPMAAGGEERPLTSRSRLKTLQRPLAAAARPQGRAIRVTALSLSSLAACRSRVRLQPARLPALVVLDQNLDGLFDEAPMAGHSVSEPV
jgi:hypothetical protein